MLYAQGACRLPRPVGASALGPRPRHRPQHSAPARLRVSPLVACLGAFSLVVGGAALGSLSTGGALADTVMNPGTGGGRVSIMNGMARAFASSPGAATLPPATAPPAPAPPSLEGAPALRPHEMFGYAPYWTLHVSSGFNLAGLTTLAYFSVGVGADATVQHSGPGWVGYQSQALADLVTRAHDAGDRVVLTASCFGQSALDKMAGDPTAGARLGASLVQLVAAKNLDGVSLDFEGEGSKDQAGLDSLVGAVSTAMHQANPHWQVTMATYASSAGDPHGFYDIGGLSASVDGFFVMAYDMNDPSTPSPTAPLTGAGFTDLDAVQQYSAVVSPSKVILGVPYYGYDWPTAGPGLGDPATGPPTPMSYAQITATGGHVYWDPTTQTAWTSYQVGTQWHQTFFDDPTSLGLKAQLADTYHIAGLGIWALGMEGNAPAMQGGTPGQRPHREGRATGSRGQRHDHHDLRPHHLCLLGHVERCGGDPHPLGPGVIDRRPVHSGVHTVGRFRHERPDASVSRSRARFARHLPRRISGPLRRHRHVAQRLRLGILGVHRCTGLTRRSTHHDDDHGVDGSDLDHDDRSELDQFHHRALTPTGHGPHTTRVSWPSQYRSFSNRL